MRVKKILLLLTVPEIQLTKLQICTLTLQNYLFNLCVLYIGEYVK